MKRVISRSALWAGLSLLLIAAVISVGQSAGTMLGDAEAQALIRRYQGQPATALTRIETQNLLNALLPRALIQAPPLRCRRKHNRAGRPRA
jgi:hypothetical protein